MLVQLSNQGQVPRASGRFEVDIARDRSFVLSAVDPITARYAGTRQRAVVVPSMTSRTIPPGAIFLWYGNEADVPPGFAVCNGTNGTPDLRDRFIRAAGTAGAGDSGTSSHTDAYGTRTTGTFTTTWDGEHHHQPGPSSWRSLVFKEYGVFSKHSGIDTGGTDYWNEPLQNAGGHDHWARAIVPDRGGTSDANTSELRPRWYALLYVMKKWAQ